MDIFDAGVMHAAAAPGLRVQSALEHCAENGGADLRPVQVLTHIFQNQVHDLVRQTGDFNIPFEEAAVHVGEVQQLLILIGIAICFRRVENAKQIDQRRAPVFIKERRQVIMELAALCAKQQRVLRVQAEHYPHAKLVQAFQRFRVGGVFVLGQH